MRSRVAAPTSPSVTTRSHPLWRLELPHRIPRFIVVGAATAGLLAAARFAVAPPTPIIRRQIIREDRGSVQTAESLALLFARAYLSWDAADPDGFDGAMSRFGGPGMEVAAGVELPSAGEDAVSWADVVDGRSSTSGTGTYTVAAQTDHSGLVYLDVPITRTPKGEFAIDGYPAIVGGPVIAPAAAVATSGEVEEPALVGVVERALRNYLAGAPDELAADLATGARITPPSLRLTLTAVQRPFWVSGRTILAVAQARDADGVQFTLAYRLAVVQAQGRWEISAIQSSTSP
jgi:hypothetical protein